MNDILDTEHEHMQEEELKTEAPEQDYTEGMKFKFDISPVKLCDHLYENSVSPDQVYTVLSNTHIDYLVQLQGIMKELFDRLDFEPANVPNFINHPPDIPEVSLDEAHAAFTATLPALTVSDTACAQVDTAAAAFADSVSDAINNASKAASALDATSKA